MEGDRHCWRHNRTGAWLERVADVAAIDLPFVIVEVQRPVAGQAIGLLIDLLAVHRPCQSLDLRGCLHCL